MKTLDVLWGSIRFLAVACSFISDILALAAILGAVVLIVATGYTALTGRRVRRSTLASPRQLVWAGLIFGGLGLASRLADPTHVVAMIGYTNLELGFILAGVAVVLALSHLVPRLTASEASPRPAGTLLNLDQTGRGKSL
jgi:hypothetical protein